MQLGEIFLGELLPEDLRWLISASEEKAFEEQQVLIEKGKFQDNLYFVSDGFMSVYDGSERDRAIGVLGPGDIFGEISFLNESRASASVITSRASRVYMVRQHRIRQKIKADPAFGSRFYRALAKTMASRFMNTYQQFYRLEQILHEQTGFTAEPCYSELRQAVDQLKNLLYDAEQSAIQRNRAISKEIAKDISAKFQNFMMLLNRCLGGFSETTPEVREKLGRWLQRELLPYVWMTDNANRWYSKPRGYAGDFYTIEMVYRNRPTGRGPLGPLLDRCFLDVPAAKAVRNRRHLLVNEIEKIIAANESRNNGAVTAVTSMACGPARELFDIFEKLSEPGRLHCQLIDIDEQALAFVRKKARRLKLSRQINLHSANLIHLAIGRQKIDLPPQDLVYSIGLIDYFSDKYVLKLLNYIHGLLKPGGTVILGNFHPLNPSRAMMDYILDWRLIHRDEADLNRLFEQSAFGAPCREIRFEDEGINLFAIGEK